VTRTLIRRVPVCANCHGKSGHPPIEGDGPKLVCYPCVMRLTHFAAVTSKGERP
jgi:cytochrome c553